MSGRSSILHDSPVYGVWGPSGSLVGSQFKNRMEVIFPYKKYENIKNVNVNTKSLSNSLLSNSFNYNLDFKTFAYDVKSY